MSSGFVDLRQNNLAERGGSFWPSFTDIMMVVVMIFMLSSVVLILRNWELVQDLRETMQAERLAEEMARSVSETNATLEERLAQAQHRLSELRLQRLQQEEESRRQRQQLSEQQQQLRLLDSRLQLTQDELQGAIRRNRLLDNQLQRSQGEYRQLQDDYARQEASLTRVIDELAALEKSHREQGERYALLQQKRAFSEQQLVELQGDYQQLKVKYDKLVKPARTAKGKYVVTVRYEKVDGEYRIQFKDGNPKGRLQAVDRSTLENRLAKLKRAYPKQLYLKIVIPVDSGLSYSEAWSFMSGLLGRYDYYYQQ